MSTALHMGHVTPSPLSPDAQEAYRKLIAITPGRVPLADVLRALEGIEDGDCQELNPDAKRLLRLGLRAALLKLGGIAPRWPFKLCGNRHKYEVLDDMARSVCPVCQAPGAARFETAAERDSYLARKLQDGDSTIQL